MFLFINGEKMKVCAFRAMVFHFAQAKQKKKITEIKAGSFSWHLFTRLLSAGWICSLSLTHVTQGEPACRLEVFRPIAHKRKCSTDYNKIYFMILVQ